MAQSELLMRTSGTTANDAGTGRQTRHYSLLVAKDSAEVQAAQRLRYHVFSEEMGARLPTADLGVDADAFDQFCDHLVVRDEETGEIVGSYRMLPPDAAQRTGQLYADDEFDLSSLAPLRGSLVETGRSCVHADHRSGAVISMVWAGILRYMLLSGHSYIAGCASVPLQDGGACAAGVWDMVSTKHFASEEHRVHPHNPWDTDSAPRPARRITPPLLRGYLRLGARVCGAPALDPEFGVADFFVLLPINSIDDRYLRYLVGKSE